MLKVSNIETYYETVMAINGVSLDLKEGGITALLGGNGAGKSTVLKSIAGVMEVQKGKIEFLGEDIGSLYPDQIMRKRISLVPEGREVFPDLTVRENLLMALDIGRL